MTSAQIAEAQKLAREWKPIWTVFFGNKTPAGSKTRWVSSSTTPNITGRPRSASGYLFLILRFQRWGEKALVPFLDRG